MKKRIFHVLGAIASLGVFIAAVSALRHELASYDIIHIFGSLGTFPVVRILIAFGLILLSISGVIAYDFLALRYLKRPLSRSRTVMASFIAFAMSSNLGASFIAGNSMRYRLYSKWNLSALEIAKIAVFCTISSALGFFSLIGLVLLFNPAMVTGLVAVPLQVIQPLGLFLLLPPLAYLFFSVARKRPFRIFKREVTLPSFRISLGQFLFSLISWSVSAAALYALLPSVAGLSYFVFLGIFLISQEAGLLSQVPGGLGVFESALLILLTPFVPGAAILQALLLYRAMYYLLPLSIGVAVLGGQEIHRRKEQFLWARKTVAGRLVNALAFVSDHWQTAAFPLPAFAFRGFTSARGIFRRPALRDIYPPALILSGAFLIFFSAIPTAAGPLGWLRGSLPLPLLDISHFLIGIIGVGAILPLFRL